jgi:hypothetical protein
MVSSKCNKCITAHRYGCYLHIQIAIQVISNAILSLKVEKADRSYALTRSVSVLGAVNWIGLAVKKIKAETVKTCFAKAGFGESDVEDNSEEVSETLLQKNFLEIQRTMFGVTTT